MNGLKDLMESMGPRLRGRVTRLGIVAHGDQPGVVRLDHPLSVSTVRRFSADLRDLRLWLTSDAMLIFYACIAGRGDEGSSLLVALSRELPQRTIVGFELYGFIGPGGLLNAPGVVTATEASDSQLALQRASQHGRLHPWCPFAKRARGGVIRHIPILEQSERPRQTCANPTCRGHSRPDHSCRGW